MRATIQAIDGWDEDGGTGYILLRPGKPDLCCAWPQPLLLLEPNARLLPSHTGEVGRQSFVVVPPSPRHVKRMGRLGTAIDSGVV